MYVLNVVRRFIAERFPVRPRATHAHGVNNVYDSGTTGSFWILHAR